jgi:hypothetical protein
LAAQQIAILAAPSIGLGWYPIDCDAQEIDTNWYRCRIKYGPRKMREPGDTDFSIYFDFGGSSQHIVQAKSHVNTYQKAGYTAPDYKGAIGVEDGTDGPTAKGCDIYVPTPTWAVKTIMSASVVTPQYRLGLYKLVAKTNNAVFMGCAIGELLLVGAAVSLSSKFAGMWEMSFKFAYSENVTNQTIGEITGIAKKGWEYLWVKYEPAVGAGGKKLIAEPAAVYVERVYDDGDFSSLGIGS